MKKKSLLFLLVLFILLLGIAEFRTATLVRAASPTDSTFSFFDPAACTGPVTPNTPGNQRQCTLCDLLKVVENVINFALILLVPIGVMAIIYGGFVYMTSGGEAGRVQQGRKIVTSAIVGIAITLAAWLIIDTVMKYLVDSSAKLKPWQTIDCVSETTSGGTSGGAPATTSATTTTSVPVPSDEQALAKIVLNDGVCGGTASCGGVNSCSSLQSVANGDPPPVCFNGCSSGSTCNANSSVHLSTSMLKAIDGLKTADGLSFLLSSLTTGSHSANSLHYRGKAADFVATGGTTYSQLETQLNQKPGIGYVQCENSAGTKIACSSSGAAHIHAEFQ